MTLGSHTILVFSIPNVMTLFWRGPPNRVVLEKMAIRQLLMILMMMMMSLSPVFLYFRALGDIEESIKELEYYQQAIFKTSKW